MEQKHCTRCGKNTVSDANYCPYCGNPLQDELHHLTMKERLNYLLLIKILLKLPKNADDADYANLAAVLADGYSLHYSDLFKSISDNEISVEESNEVLDILEMYSSIVRSYNLLCKMGVGLKNLSDNNIVFPGFDANNEAKQYSYADYFLFKLNRYEELHDFAVDLNSHRTTLPFYRDMLKKWNELKQDGKAYNMTEDQILELLKYSCNA